MNHNKRTQLDAVLSEAWEQYAKVMYVQSLGSCIRRVCNQMQHPDHSILDKLDGSVACQYLEQHYVKENK